jgi:hypothetical protein
MNTLLRISMLLYLSILCPWDPHESDEPLYLLVIKVAQMIAVPLSLLIPIPTPIPTPLPVSTSVSISTSLEGRSRRQGRKGIQLAHGKFIITPEHAADELYYPGYNAALTALFDISDRQYEQGLIIADEAWPSDVTNGATYVLGWKPHFNDTTALIVFCTHKSFFCYWMVYSYMPNARALSSHWVPNSAAGGPRYIYKNSPAGFHVFKGEDPRIILAPSRTRLFMVYNEQFHVDGGEGFRTTFCAELTFDAADMSSYLSRQPVRLDISHLLGKSHEKNWSPFFYYRGFSQFNGSHANERTVDKRKLSTEAIQLIAQNALNGTHDHDFELLFIHTSMPHRVIRSTRSLYDALMPAVINNSHWSTVPVVSMQIVSESVLPSQWPIIWKYGWPPRGGTAAQLTNTPFGWRYLTIFHSSGHTLSNKLSTYFMGVYLFDVQRPFNITHVSKEPLVANAMYNDTYGWCARSGYPDYSVFPVGMNIDTNTGRMYVNWGKNNHQSRMLTINLEEMYRNHLVAL